MRIIKVARKFDLSDKVFDTDQREADSLYQSLNEFLCVIISLGPIRLRPIIQFPSQMGIPLFELLKNHEKLDLRNQSIT